MKANWGALTGIALAIAVFTGCASEKIGGSPPVNKQPHVEVTGGPPTRPDGELVRDVYTVSILWKGWDDDGIVTGFEYALDIDLAWADSNSVTGNRDGNPFPEINDPRTPIEWTPIVGFEGSFQFSATTPDSTGGIIREPTGTYSGNHFFYIRAIDDQGGISDVDYIAFTATTVAPKTVIDSPIPNPSGLTVGTDLYISWTGTDDDSPHPRKTPAFYEYKLIKINSIFLSACFEIYKDSSPWTRVGAETTSVRFEQLESEKIYAFAVRAVDEAGATEPFCVDEFSNQEKLNAFRFQVLDTAGFPELVVNEPTLGEFRCVSGAPEIVELPVGTRLRFEMTADARIYGSSIGGYNWGVDLADPSREDPESGWRGWSSQNFTDNFPVFTKAGTHYVYLRTRDTGTPPKQTLCVIQLEYVEFPRDKDVLYIDDSVTQNKPKDAVQDSVMYAMLDTAVGLGVIPSYDVFEIFGPGDVLLDSQVLTLRQISRYKLLVWNVKGEGRGATVLSAWRRATTGAARTSEKILPGYIKAGGQLMVAGTKVVGATDATSPFNYPKTELDLKTGNFAYEFLHLRTTFLDASVISGTALNDGMWGADPCAGSAGEREGYPILRVDPAKISTPAKTFDQTEAVFAPFDPRAPAGLDTLYCYRAYGPNVQSKQSAWELRPCAFRFASRAAVPEQGKVVYFGFPLELLQNDQIQSLFAKLMTTFFNMGASAS